MESKAWRDEAVKLRWCRIKKGFVNSESGFYLERNKELRRGLWQGRAEAGMHFQKNSVSVVIKSN